MTLDAAATPELVEKLGAMFAETLRQVDPALSPGEVTMRIENYAAAAEIRGWHRDGAHAVRLTCELVDNATEAVQKHEHLEAAARTLASHAAKLTSYNPKFWRKDKLIRAVDDVFVRTMRAAGLSVAQRGEDELSGETIVYSPVLRVGRVQENGHLQARIRVAGRPVEAHVADRVVAHVWEVAKCGEIVPLRLRGRWVESDDGDLRLTHPEIVGIDSTYRRWTGHDLLEDIKQYSALFSADDFDRILEELEAPARED